MDDSREDGWVALSVLEFLRSVVFMLVSFRLWGFGAAL
jgi:hypothetical protein